MTYEQMLKTCQALDPDCTIRMRKPGDWYVDWRVEMKDGGVLRSEYGNGVSPVDAIHNHWTIVATLPSNQYLVIEADVPSRRHAVRWNGFMWAPVVEPEPERSR